MNTELVKWKNSGHYFQYQHHQLFFKFSRLAANNKPVLLCLHGFPMSSWDWHTLWPELSQHYDVIALDLLGFGFSDKPTNHVYSVIEHADIAEALLKHLDVTHYHLIAHDFATLIAQELLDRNHHRDILPTPSNPPYPPTLDKVFAMSGSIFPELSHPRLIQKLLISPIGCFITKCFNEKKFAQSMKRVLLPTTNSPQLEHNQALLIKSYWQLLTLQQGQAQLHKLNFFLNDRKTHGERWGLAWQESNRTIRYAVGQQDPMYGGPVVDQLKQLSNHKDIHVVTSSGHFPHIESPQQILGLIKSFF